MFIFMGGVQSLRLETADKKIKINMKWQTYCSSNDNSKHSSCNKDASSGSSSRAKPSSSF